ncbi:hypothetical protein C6A37_01195 [Desulfobacteraceae bacterium SEEP-SAG9]|nr:hypothetical protein C6A37_01195 [Desulfobacteraceae bacterium SEEP-SAG9]
MFDIKKINQAKILAERIKNEMNSENLDNALYLTDTFILLFSGHQPATTEIVKSYTVLSRNLIKDSKLEEAEKIISKALLIDPDNSEILSILVGIKKHQHNQLKKYGQTTKSLAYKFIENHYPRELKLFDIAWRVFKDITPKDFKQEATAGALGIVGKEGFEVKTSKVIVLLNHLNSVDLASLEESDIRKIALKAGQDIGCSSNLVNQLIDFIMK